MVMDLCFDTSAIVALLLVERNSAQASHAWASTSRAWAWRWLEVETEAALVRRKASPLAWAQWRTVAACFHWLDLEPAVWPQLRSFNRPLRLRAADAGHLFVFDRLLGAVPGLELVTFDREMSRAAEMLGLPLHAGNP